jgi:hypothetical protein
LIKVKQKIILILGWAVCQSFFAAKAVEAGGGGVAWVMQMARGGCQMPINRRANGA